MSIPKKKKRRNKIEKSSSIQDILQRIFVHESNTKEVMLNVHQ